MAEDSVVQGNQFEIGKPQAGEQATVQIADGADSIGGLIGLKIDF